MLPPDQPVQETDEGCRLFVHARPGAKQDALKGLHGGRLKVQVKAPPVDGAANDAIATFLARQLGVQTRDVTLTAGASARHKTFHIVGVTASQARARLDL
jgi:uncharacterized protein